MNHIKREIVIMAYSPFADKFVETERGTFVTVSDAELAGSRIKSSSWLVANRVTRLNNDGSTQVTHEFLTQKVDPRVR